MSDFVTGVLWGVGFTLLFVLLSYRPVLRHCIRIWPMKFTVYIREVGEESSKSPSDLSDGSLQLHVCEICEDTMREEYIKSKVK